MDKITWTEFLNRCAVPDDWRWSGIAPKIVSSHGNYHVAHISKNYFLDDELFEIVEKTEDGLSVRWGNQPEEDVIVDYIGDAYIILSGTLLPPVELAPACSFFFSTSEDAKEWIEINLLGEQIPHSPKS